MNPPTGQTQSATWKCGSKLENNLYRKKSSKDAGNTLATLSANPLPTSQGMPCSGTPRGRGRGADLDQTKRHLEADSKRSGHTWGQLERLTQDRDA